jgi:multiple sugar transport system ATP-binding protein
MFVGGFVGSPPMNFLRLAVRDGRVVLDGLSIEPPAGAGGEILLGIRPEDLEMAESGMEFRVRVTEPLGSHVLLTGDVAGQQLRVMVPDGTAPRAGETRRLRPVPGRISWMDAASGEAIVIPAREQAA